MKEDIQEEIRDFILSLDLSKYDFADDFEIEGLTLTVSVNDDWSEWAFQTGDNSYSGPCYHHSVWAVVSINYEDNRDYIIHDLIGQLEENHVDY